MRIGVGYANSENLRLLLRFCGLALSVVFMSTPALADQIDGMLPPPPAPEPFYVNSFFDVFLDLNLSNGTTISIDKDAAGNTGSLYIDSITLQLSGNETLGQVGFMVSNTLIPLDQLNYIGNDEYQYTLPTPYNGSYDVVPEPGSLAMIGTGLVGLSLLRRRRKQPV